MISGDYGQQRNECSAFNKKGIYRGFEGIKLKLRKWGIINASRI